MTTNPDFASVAALIADPSRAAMLSMLLGGYLLPASELARHAHISPQTASAHLAKLVNGGLLCVTKSGRHRYYYLSGPEVAQALEALALIAPMQRTRSLRQGLETQALHFARTCYDHLAGTLGVMVTQALVDRQIVEQCGESFEVTVEGTVWFSQFGINTLELQQRRRRFAVTCVDWSERKPHLAGSLGTAIVDRMLDLKWIVRSEESRAVKITACGYQMLEQELGIKLR